MLKIDILDAGKQHFLVSSDEPARVEVSVVDGNVVLYGYKGILTDMDQDPDVLYVNFSQGPDYILGDNPRPYDPLHKKHVEPWT